MAVVNIDLSEYDAIRKRNSELELRILNLLPKINKLATELNDDLVKRFFMPKRAVELTVAIIDITTK